MLFIVMLMIHLIMPVMLVMLIMLRERVKKLMHLSIGMLLLRLVQLGFTFLLMLSLVLLCSLLSDFMHRLHLLIRFHNVVLMSHRTSKVLFCFILRMDCLGFVGLGLLRMRVSLRHFGRLFLGSLLIGLLRFCRLGLRNLSSIMQGLFRDLSVLLGIDLLLLGLLHLVTLFDGIHIRCMKLRFMLLELL